MKNKKVLIISIISIIFFIAIIVGIVIQNMPKDKPEEVLNKYFALINDRKYDEMYEILSRTSKEKIKKEEFIKRNKNIYEGIDGKIAKVYIHEESKENKKQKISYDQDVLTAAGIVTISNNAYLEREDKTYKLDWKSELIFPQLKDNYKVKVEILKGKRGSILDREGNKLAYDGKISLIGIVPGKLSENKEEDIGKVSQILGIPTEYINKELSKSYVKEDTFVPLKKVSKDNTELKGEVLKVQGVQINDKDGRVYTLGEEIAHLIGYVQTINEEELKKYADKGYTSISMIGKSGLELAYEDRLKAKDGVKIYIADEYGNVVEEIAKQEQKDGENIKLTINSEIQKNYILV